MLTYPGVPTIISTSFILVLLLTRNKTFNFDGLDFDLITFHNGLILCLLFILIKEIKICLAMLVAVNRITAM